MLHKPYGILYNYNERGKSGRLKKSGGSKKIKRGKLVYYVNTFESFIPDRLDFNTVSGSMIMMPTKLIKKPIYQKRKSITLFKKRFYPQPGIKYG